MTTDDIEIANIEIDLLLEAIYKRYGYDFRSYSRSSLERRLTQFLIDKQCGSYSEVINRLLRDRSFFYELITYFSISVTALFRDPFFYSALRDKVLPFLKTWPYFKIWHAGCATGEEAYSMAILLNDEQLLNRAMLYATDISQSALTIGKTGVYPLETIKMGSINYLKSGGSASLSHYYHANYGNAAIKPYLKKSITFSLHNLVTDKSFGEMQMIVCRNVLIYFNDQLKEQVLQLFWESLEYGGFLCLGDTESLMFSSVADKFITVDEHAKIYKKKI
ncbi:MAG: protein-glutamate O-methyltransferase CheR [Methylococcales bacterium]|nr:MAG: protein-glutamate O-methyltransferase CheR [Methylococcales bacterium]